MFINQTPSNYCSFCLFFPSREELQEAQWQAAKANRVPCKNCGRRFAQDRIGVHERICKGSKKGPPGASGDGESNETGGGVKERSVKVKIDCFQMRMNNTDHDDNSTLEIIPDASCNAYHLEFSASLTLHTAASFSG